MGIIPVPPGAALCCRVVDEGTAASCLQVNVWCPAALAPANDSKAADTVSSPACSGRPLAAIMESST